MIKFKRCRLETRVVAYPLKTCGSRDLRDETAARAAARLHLSPLTGMLLVHLFLALAPLGGLGGATALAPPLRVSKRHVACANAATRTTSAVTMSMDDGDSLTLAQLRARLLPAWHALCALAEERGGTTSRTDCSAAEWASRTLLATRLERLALDRCQVSESTIAAAGNGVFASRDISAGELITLYPGDGVRVEAGAEGAEAAEPTAAS